MKKILFTNQEGGLSIVTPNPSYSMEDVIASSVPEGVEYTIVDVSEIPTDRAFRNAWEFKDKKVKVNLNKARKLVKEEKEKEFKEHEKMLEAFPSMRTEFEKNKKTALGAIDVMDLDELKVHKEKDK